MNDLLTQVAQKRVSHVEVTGNLLRSKLTRKVRNLEQALRYRSVELASGAASLWNIGNALGSIILSRSLIETAALIYDVERKVSKCIVRNDLDELETVVMKESFSARLENWVGEPREFQATNILTLTGKLEKEVPNLRAIYDGLSERAHPNSLGHCLFFGSISPADYVTTSTLE